MSTTETRLTPPGSPPSLCTGRNPSLDYSKSCHPFVVSRFILEASRRLEFDVLSTATAASLFHAFRRRSTNPDGYDPYLMAGACLYLAGKVEEDADMRLRDVINVLRSCLHPNKPPLSHDSEYFNHREAIVEAELLLLRILDFRVKFAHPHTFLLQYLKTLKDWLSPDTWSSVPLGQTAWRLLQDFYHEPFVLDWRDSLVALAVIYLTLQIYGVVLDYVPPKDEHLWIQVLDPKADMNDIHELCSQIMSVYADEVKWIGPLIIEEEGKPPE